MKEIEIAEGDRKIKANSESICKNQVNIKTSFWQIGKALVNIRDIIKSGNSSFRSFEEFFYQQEDFEFSIMHADKLMKVISTIPHHEGFNLTLSKLITLAYVRDDETRKRLIKKSPGLSETELIQEKKEIHLKQIGKELPYMDSPEIDTESEYRLKVERDIENLLYRLKQYEESMVSLKRQRENLIKGLNQFIKEVSKKLPEHNSIEQAKKLLRTLSSPNEVK